MVITVLKEDAQGNPPDLADLQNWANSQNITHPVVLGQEITWGLAGGFPTYFVLDQNMLCRYKEAGYDQRALLDLINQLLSNPPTPLASPTPDVPTNTPTPTAEPSTPTPTATDVPPTNTPDPYTPTPTMTPTPNRTPGTPSPTATPPGTPEPSPTAGPFSGVALHLSASTFRAGMEFLLTADMDADVAAGDFYCALDVFGSYFFFPDWGQEVGMATVNLPATMNVLGPFTWPSVEGSIDGVKFWAILCREGTFDFFPDIGYVEFGYAE